MKTATLIKVPDGFSGDARLYKLSEPVEYDEHWDEDGLQPARKTNYVIVSAAQVMFSGPETYIFPADEEGEVLNWGELNGSFKGGLDHEEALNRAGYKLA